MRNLKIQKAPFIDSDLLVDISNGNRKFSLVRELIHGLYMPVGGAATSALVLSPQQVTPAMFTTLVTLAAVGSFAIECYVVYGDKKAYREEFRKSLFNIQELVDGLRVDGIYTSLPNLLESCILLTDNVNVEYACTQEGTRKKKEAKHIEDIVFYDDKEQAHVLRQTNVLDKKGLTTTISEQRLDLLEPTDEDYKKVMARTKNRIVSR